MARAATALKLAVSWFLLASVFHAWDKEQLNQTGSLWGRYTSDIWSGEAASRGEYQMPVTLFLVIVTKPDYTYDLTHRSFTPVLKAHSILYREAGFWKIEGGRFVTSPKVCQATVNIEYGWWGRVPCQGGDSWSIDLTEDRTWRVEENIGESRYTFPMKRIN